MFLTNIESYKNKTIAEEKPRVATRDYEAMQPHDML